MTTEDKKETRPGHPEVENQAASEASPKRHGASRRDLLKKIAATGAVVGGVHTLPEKWKRPIIDSVMLPVHAQTSPLCTLTAVWVIGDDAPGGLGGISDGTTDAADFLYDDGTDMHLRAHVNPAQAIAVNLNVDIFGTNYGDNNFPTGDVVSNAGTGHADFGDWTPPDSADFDSTFGATPGDGTITLTLSAEGCVDSVIILNLGSAAD